MRGSEDWTGRCGVCRAGSRCPPRGEHCQAQHLYGFTRSAGEERSRPFFLLDLLGVSSLPCAVAKHASNVSAKDGLGWAGMGGSDSEHSCRGGICAQPAVTRIDSEFLTDDMRSSLPSAKSACSRPVDSTTQTGSVPCVQDKLEFYSVPSLLLLLHGAFRQMRTLVHKVGTCEANAAETFRQWRLTPRCASPCMVVNIATPQSLWQELVTILIGLLRCLPRGFILVCMARERVRKLKLR